MANQKFKVKVQADAGVQLPASTASRALQLDGSGNVESSAVTTTELGYVSGVTSALQTQLGNKVNTSAIGANNGVASLDSGGKIPAAQLPNTVMEYQGNWNASTNSPTLADGTGSAGDVYRVNVAGTQNLGSGSQTFVIGDWVVYNGTIWEKSINSNAVGSVNGQTGTVTVNAINQLTGDVTAGPASGSASAAATLATVNSNVGSFGSATQVAGFTVNAKGLITAAANTAIAITSAAVTDFNEAAQDAVGGILTDSSSVDFTYNDAGNTITAAVLPAGVDHNSLNNYVANQHVDHTSVQIATAANSGLTGGGTIAATRNLSVDINGTTAETSADNADKILIYDNSATALKSMTRANFLSGIPTGSAGDINETSFSAANNQASAANVTGLAFANGTVRSFKALVSVTIDATADLFESFELQGIQKGAAWDMSVSSVGDDSGLVLSITTAGQVQYTSTNLAGFTSNTVKFRAYTTSV